MGDALLPGGGVSFLTSAPCEHTMLHHNRISLGKFGTHQFVPATLRAGAHRQLKDRLLTAELISSVALRLVRTGSLPTMLQEVAELLCQRLDLCFVGLWLDDHVGGLAPVALSVKNKLPLPLDEIEKRIYVIARQREPLVIAEPEIASNWGPPLSCAAFALQAARGPLGVLAAFSESSLPGLTVDRLNAVRSSIALEVQLRLHQN